MTTTNEKSKVFSIILEGIRHSGKSTTIQEVCKRLKPSEIHRLCLCCGNLIAAKVADINNDTFILNVKGKHVLVVAGSPTEQNRTITQIYGICLKNEIEISFILSAKRPKERSGYSTANELKKIGTLLFREPVVKIPDDNFKETDAWKNRVNKIVNIILNKLTES
jgi:hypothetical protein